MKDILQNIIQYTAGLGNIDLIKIIGTDKETVIHAAGEDKTVIVTGTLAQPVSDFIGTFGMPNLSKLKTILSLEVYREDPKLSINKQQNAAGETVPSGVHFENKDGDFKNDYRFMTAEIVNEKLKAVKFRGVNWHVEVTPTVSSINRFQFQAGANTEHTTFLAKTDGDKLIFRILDNGTPQTLSWNATYTVIGVTLPTTTTANKTTYVGCVYNANNTRWDVIAVTTQA